MGSGLLIRFPWASPCDHTSLAAMEDSADRSSTNKRKRFISECIWALAANFAGNLSWSLPVSHHAQRWKMRHSGRWETVYHYTKLQLTAPSAVIRGPKSSSPHQQHSHSTFVISVKDNSRPPCETERVCSCTGSEKKKWGIQNLIRAMEGWC